MAASTESLVGTWRLLSLEAHGSDGSVSYPMGPDSLGYLTYTADGFMYAALMRANRQPFASVGLHDGTSEELSRAGREYSSYCGRYSVHDDKVVHHVELSYFPNWIGNDQERFITLEGDRLTITTRTTRGTGTVTLIWERAR